MYWYLLYITYIPKNNDFKTAKYYIHKIKKVGYFLFYIGVRLWLYGELLLYLQQKY